MENDQQDEMSKRRFKKNASDIILFFEDAKEVYEMALEAIRKKDSGGQFDHEMMLNLMFDLPDYLSDRSNPNANDLSLVFELLEKFEKTVCTHFLEVCFAVGTFYLYFYRFQKAVSVVTSIVPDDTDNLPILLQWKQMWQSQYQDFCGVLPHIAPNAVCRSPECSSHSHVEGENENIYFGSPSFLGMVQTICNNKFYRCITTYHLACWNAKKESAGSKKVSDKGMLLKKCSTPDCTNGNGERCVIKRIDIFDSEMRLKKTFEAQVEDTTKRTKSAPTPKPPSQPPTKPPMRKRCPSSNQKASAPPKKVPRNLAPKEVPPAQATECDNDLHDEQTLDMAVDFLKQMRKENFGFSKEKTWRPNLYMYGSEYMMETAGALGDPDFSNDSPDEEQRKGFIFSYFHSILSSNGPMKIDDLKKECVKAQKLIDDCDSVLQNPSNIADFLTQSLKFVVVGSYICVPENLPEAYDQAKNADCGVLKFFMENYIDPDSTSPSLGDDLIDDINNREMRYDLPNTDDAIRNAVEKADTNVTDIRAAEGAEMRMDKELVDSGTEEGPLGNEGEIQADGSEMVEESSIEMKPELSADQNKQDEECPPKTQANGTETVEENPIEIEPELPASENEKDEECSPKNQVNGTETVEESRIKIEPKLPSVQKTKDERSSPKIQADETETVAKSSVEIQPKLPAKQTKKDEECSQTCTNGNGKLPTNSAPNAGNVKKNFVFPEQKKTRRVTPNSVVGQKRVDKNASNGFSDRASNGLSNKKMTAESLNKNPQSTSPVQRSAIDNEAVKSHEMSDHTLPTKEIPSESNPSPVNAINSNSETEEREIPMRIEELKTKIDELTNDLATSRRETESLNYTLSLMKKANSEWVKHSSLSALHFQYITEKSVITTKLEEWRRNHDLIYILARALRVAPDRIWPMVVQTFPKTKDLERIRDDFTAKYKTATKQLHQQSDGENILPPPDRIPEFPTFILEEVIHSAFRMLHQRIQASPYNYPEFRPAPLVSPYEGQHLYRGVNLVPDLSQPMTFNHPPPARPFYDPYFLAQNGNGAAAAPYPFAPPTQIHQGPHLLPKKGINMYGLQAPSQNGTNAPKSSAIPTPQEQQSQALKFPLQDFKFPPDISKSQEFLNSQSTFEAHRTQSQTKAMSPSAIPVKTQQHPAQGLKEISKSHDILHPQEIFDSQGLIKSQGMSKSLEMQSSSSLSFPSSYPSNFPSTSSVDRPRNLGNNGNQFSKDSPGELPTMAQPSGSHQVQQTNCHTNNISELEHFRDEGSEKSNSTVNSTQSEINSQMSAQGGKIKLDKPSGHSIDKVMRLLRSRYVGVLELDLLKSVEAVRKNHKNSLSNLKIVQIVREVDKFIKRRQEKELIVYPMPEARGPLKTENVATRTSDLDCGSPLTKAVSSTSVHEEKKYKTPIPLTPKKQWEPIPVTHETWKKSTLESECAICLETITGRTANHALPCNHTYHKKCIQEWYQTCKGGIGTCPECRKSSAMEEDYPYLPRG